MYNKVLLFLIFASLVLRVGWQPKLDFCDSTLPNLIMILQALYGNHLKYISHGMAEISITKFEVENLLP